MALRFLVGIVFLLFVAVPGFIGAEAGNNRARASEQLSRSKLSGGWYLVRARNPHGGPDAISIMRTADILRSDLDLAGLMIRCNQNRPEVLIVLLRPYSLGARLNVTFGELGKETQIKATVAPPGTVVLIPMDATSLVTITWKTVTELFVRISDNDSTIRGIISLAGLQSAFKILMESCPAH